MDSPAGARSDAVWIVFFMMVPTVVLCHHIKLVRQPLNNNYSLMCVMVGVGARAETKRISVIFGMWNFSCCLRRRAMHRMRIIIASLTSTSAATMSFPGRAVQRAWHLVDASSQTVGRLATKIAPILKGKHKPTYRPNGDCGDVVVVINAEKVILLWIVYLLVVSANTL